MNEAIEKDAEKYAELSYYNRDEVNAFVNGVKYQAKRMYSEANKIISFLDNEYKLGISDKQTIERLKWYFETYFEQFKKK